jgi:hypothetical protein
MIIASLLLPVRRCPDGGHEEKEKEENLYSQ